MIRKKYEEIVFFIALLITSVVRADVMNLNEFVPTHLEDATPVDVGATIYQLTGEFEKASPDTFTWRPDIRYGLNKKIQLEAQGDLMSGGRESRGGEAKAAVQYKLNESDNAFPVIARRKSFTLSERPRKPGR
jgi:hypothetical protein